MLLPLQGRKECTHPEVSLGKRKVRTERVAFREENAVILRPYRWKGRGCAQWSGSPPLPPDELALPSAPMADTQEFGTDTSSAAEHPLCSNTDGSICRVGMWDIRSGQLGK